MKFNIFDKAINMIAPKKPLEDVKLEKESLPTPEDEKILSSREKSSSKNLGGGCNETVFIELRDDGKGIFKPKKGEKENLRDNIETGSYYKRERAAYLVDMMLGLNLVPPTVIREMDGEIGSLQRFIEDAKTIREISYEEREELELEMIKMGIFDYIIWNSDRHGDNFLVKEKRFYAIDNGLSFASDALDTYEYLYNKKIPQDAIDKIKIFLSSDKKAILQTLLEELIPEKEVKACIKRIEILDKAIKGGLISENENLELKYN